MHSLTLCYGMNVCTWLGFILSKPDAHTGESYFTNDLDALKSPLKNQLDCWT